MGEEVFGMLRGTVTDASGAGLAGVDVKVFEEGFLIQETQTTAGGAYEIGFRYLADLNWTMVVWFVPPSTELICEIVILRESLKSKELDLWSPCLPRIELEPIMKYDAQLLTEAGKLAQMSELDCLRDQAD